MGGRGAGSPAVGNVSSKAGDKWVAEMDKRRNAETKQIKKEQAEQDAAVAGIWEHRNKFDPNVPVHKKDNYDPNTGYLNDKYMDSYHEYRRKQTDLIMDKIQGLTRAGQKAEFEVHSLEFDMNTKRYVNKSNKLTITKLSKSERGSLEIRLNGKILAQYGVTSTGGMRQSLTEDF